MDLIAHRGYPDEGVENALPTLVAATGRADAVEFDVRRSRDGVPVVFHDERVDRLTAATGPVETFDADELIALSLEGTAATIPTLATVLEELTGPVVPDLKVDAVDEGLVDQLQSYDGRVLASSFRPALLSDLPAGIKRGVLVAPPDEAREWAVPSTTPTAMAEGIQVAASLSADTVHPHTSLCTADSVAEAHAAGFAVNAWTVRSRETARAVREGGVDGAIADSPRYVCEA